MSFSRAADECLARSRRIITVHTDPFTGWALGSRRSRDPPALCVWEDLDEACLLKNLRVLIWNQLHIRIWMRWLIWQRRWTGFSRSVVCQTVCMRWSWSSSALSLHVFCPSLVYVLWFENLKHEVKGQRWHISTDTIGRSDWLTLLLHLNTHTHTLLSLNTWYSWTLRGLTKQKMKWFKYAMDSVLIYI